MLLSSLLARQEQIDKVDEEEDREKSYTVTMSRERERIKGGSEIGEEGGKSNRRFSFFS